MMSLEGHSTESSSLAFDIYSVSFDASGSILASGCGDHTLKLWDVASGECLRTLDGHSGDVW
eukprot:SAG31_NODE_37152_length_306_cov_1.985507_1_plen_61_part_10